MIRPLFLAVAAIAALALASAQPTNAAEKVDIVTVRDGVTMKFLVNADAGPQAPIVVLMMGGNGVARLDRWDGTGNPNGNFLTRIRGDLARAGFVVALPDAPSDRQNQAGLANSRVGRAHAEDIAKLIEKLKTYSSGPVFMVGTSRGTVSTVGIASHGLSKLAGIVLTAAVTRANKKGNRDPIQAADLGKISVPVLFVHHKQDSCYVCVPEHVPDLAKKFTASPSVRIEIVDGEGRWRGDPCQAFHAHGFVGIEDKVTADIAQWIRTVTAGGKP